MRILIADDEKGLGNIFRLLLDDAIPNSQIDVATNGSEAEELFENGKHDVVVLDISMPNKDGYNVCLEIQEICKQQNVKMPFVIFSSGYAASEEIKDLLVDKSHYAYLVKPVKCEDLIATIRAHGKQSKASINDENLTQIEDLKAKTNCHNNFKCMNGGFKTLCEVRDISMQDHLLCLEEDSSPCSFSISFGSWTYCKCPLRMLVERSKSGL